VLHRRPFRWGGTVPAGQTDAMNRSLMCVVVSVGLLAAACGSDDQGASSETAATAAAAPAETDAVADAEPSDEDVATPSTDASSEGTSPEESDDGGAGSSGATATLELATGESLEFSILCMLEPQMAAGSEILFTAVSYDDPGLDVTQFGDEGTVTGLSVITVYNGDFETLWEASSVFEAFGGSLELAVEGSSIVGSGSFYENADPAADPVEGTLRADC